MTAPWTPAMYRDALDTDDQHNEGRRRDNTHAATALASRTGWLQIEPGAELPWPCRHHDDPDAPDCPSYEHCCADDPCTHIPDPEEWL